MAVKTNDNQDWYMVDRWLGMAATEATLYQTAVGGYEKLYVPGGKVITFYLTDNGDDTLNLSYIAEDCLHEDHSTEGLCTVCGAEVGHDWEETVTPTTCTAPGAIIRTCTHCGGSESERISAIGHRFESAVTSPTCSIPGYTTHTCTICGYSFSNSEIPPKGHTDMLMSAQAPGCTSAGISLYRCTVCGYWHTEAVSPTGHQYVANITAPTCSTEGFTTYLFFYKKCPPCPKARRADCRKSPKLSMSLRTSRRLVWQSPK